MQARSVLRTPVICYKAFSFISGNGNACLCI